jgi:cell fate regulator YaaT (PSP1 superfamily)
MPCNGCTNRGLTHSSQDASLRAVSGLNKLRVNDWLGGYTDKSESTDLVEVRFKSTRKEFFINEHKLQLKKGDMVAVESHHGHDVGSISLTGALVLQRIRKTGGEVNFKELKKIFRKASENDRRTWTVSMEREQPTLLRARKIIQGLGLMMKLSDVEFQGDNSKATFYYIADDRVDFRELIKILAKEFRVHIEMKQIGVRQEAGRIGGLGSCGRELCCSSWKTNFQSIGLNAAKIQDLQGSAEKFAGHCGKLKCCLMYELDNYVESREDLPKVLLELETDRGIAYHHKTDILKRIMYYSYEKESMDNLIPVPVDRVKEIIGQNKRGITNVSIILPVKATKDIGFTIGS